MPIPVTLTLTQPFSDLEVYDMDGPDRMLNQPGDYVSGDTIACLVHSTSGCGAPRGRLHLRGDGIDTRLTVRAGEVLWP